MKTMKLSNLRFLPAERLSRSILYILIGLTVCMFGAFYLVFYHLPYEEDPSLNAPLLTGVLIGFLIALVTLAILIAIASAIHALRHRDPSERMSNGVSVRRNARIITTSILLLLTLTFVTGSTTSVQVNGAAYRDVFWLKTSDMFIVSSMVLIITAFIIIGLNWMIERLKGK